MNTESTPAKSGESTSWPAVANDNGIRTEKPVDSGQAGPGLNAGTLGETSIALIAVIAMILVAGWLLKRFGGARGEHSDRLRVVASRGLGQRERVVVVEIEGRWLVLGVTAHNVRTLDTMPAPPPEPNRPPTANPSFGEAFATQLRQASARFGRGSPD